MLCKPTGKAVLLHDENHRAVLLAQLGGVIGITQQAGTIDGKTLLPDVWYGANLEKRMVS